MRIQPKILNNRLEKDFIPRDYCYKCYRAKKTCLCESIKPFLSNMHLVILMHPKEARKQRTGTGRLANLSLINSELIIDTVFTKNEKVNSLLEDKSYYPVVLFPTNDAIKFKSGFENNLKVELSEKKLLVFVIDGTWSCAKKMLNRSKNLTQLKKLSFSNKYKSQFTIKRQPKENCLSTIEAIYYLFREYENAGFENLNGFHENLMTLFKKLVGIQLDYIKNAKTLS